MYQTFMKYAKSFNKLATPVTYIFCSSVVFNKYGGNIIFLTGDSMLPTIINGDVVFTRTYNPRKHEINKNDIVCVKSPTDPNILLCKRVALLEHDEDNISMNPLRPSKRIAAGHCFLLGDNYAASSDSRAFGPVPMGLIYSRVILRIWPLTRFGFVE